MYKINMCIILAIVVMLLILQIAENVSLCFTEEEWRQIKAAIKQFTDSVIRKVKVIFFGEP